MKISMKAIRDKMKTNYAEHQAYMARGHEDYGIRHVPLDLWPLILIGKIHEEAEEIRGDMENPEEYADLVEALLTLAAINGVSVEQIERARQDKFNLKGGFTAGKTMFKPYPPVTKSYKGTLTNGTLTNGSR